MMFSQPRENDDASRERHDPRRDRCAIRHICIDASVGRFANAPARQIVVRIAFVEMPSAVRFPHIVAFGGWHVVFAGLSCVRRKKFLILFAVFTVTQRTVGLS